MAKKQQNMWKWLAIALGSVLAVSAIVAVTSAITKSAGETTRELTTNDYALYVLDDTTGIADKEDQSNISTNAFYKIDDLEVELEKDATVKYQLNFYNEDKEFVKVETRSADFDGTEIEGLKAQGIAYVRLEILPQGDADGVVSIFEKKGYVEQLTVTVSKDVEEEAEEEETESSTEEESAAV